MPAGVVDALRPFRGSDEESANKTPKIPPSLRPASVERPAQPCTPEPLSLIHENEDIALCEREDSHEDRGGSETPQKKEKVREWHGVRKDDHRRQADRAFEDH